jgi:UDP-GlcNAc:undecaprenyl-phosphate/decaprenyl-phosphate GlcNAc-1-phosphate transferase
MDLYLPLILLSFLAAFIVTPLIGRLARYTGFIDEPKPHKMHVRPIPLLGGLAIYLALGVAFLRVDTSTNLVEMAAVGAGGTLLMLVGMWDDRRGMAPRIKLLAQLLAGLLAAAVGIQVHLFPWPVVNLLITLFWFVGITNAVNLMDNMDGLAAGTSAVSALFFTLLAASAGQGLIASLAAAVTGASLGFLYYNISPAMVFMGDTGSLLLGFLLAVIGIRYSPETLPIGSTWMVPIVVLGLPIFDTTLVTFSRLWSRRPVSLGGTDHTSHRLARLGLGINRAVLTMYLAAALLGVAAIFITQSAPVTATAVFIGLLAVGLAGLIFLERARPMPPANPVIAVLAQDDQALVAIAAARTLTTNVVVIPAPRCSAKQLEKFLRALALSADAFSAWMDSSPAAAPGPAENWHEVFRLAGRVVPAGNASTLEGIRAQCREARVVVLCRGNRWPADIRQAIADCGNRLLIAPEAEAPGGSPVPQVVWNDPPRLARILEDTLIGYRRKEKIS